MVLQWQTLFYNQRYSNTVLHAGPDADGNAAKGTRVPDFVKLSGSTPARWGAGRPGASPVLSSHGSLSPEGPERTGPVPPSSHREGRRKPSVRSERRPAADPARPLGARAADARTWIGLGAKPSSRTACPTTLRQ
ncbi:hypothetical protein DLE01_36535 [Streptomyces sp. FT05W]|nr:hypothetical protein DLE01_36535 [Streptomyces sp. FT05W]